MENGLHSVGKDFSLDEGACPAEVILALGTVIKNFIIMEVKLTALIALRRALVLRNSASNVRQFVPTRTFWSKLLCDIPKFQINVILFTFLLFEQKF